jgi:hypothetical protein
MGMDESQISQENENQEEQEIIQALPESRGHAEELVDHYWGSINYVTGLIKASEIKAGLILSFYGIVLNFIYQHVGLVIAQASHFFFLFVLLGLWLLATLASIYYSIRCFMPRIETKFDKNIFFFGDVIKKYGNIKEFSRTFYQISLDEEELFHQLGQQIFINSKIAASKFKNVNRSIRLLAVGLALSMAIGVSYVIVTA